MVASADEHSGGEEARGRLVKQRVKSSRSVGDRAVKRREATFVEKSPLSARTERR